MTPIIHNRDFVRPADGWYQIEVPGEHVNKQTGIVQVIDHDAVESIANRFNQDADNYANRTGHPYPGMLIDVEHFKHNPEKETRAYGWLMAMQNRNGTLFGKIKWTATGEKAVDGGEYRFFSTEYDPNDLTVLNNTKPPRVRPMRLDGLTLTNDPNNKGGLPITNRSIDGVDIPKHHAFATDEEFAAAAKKNAAELEANKAAEETSKAESERLLKGTAVKLSRPHLEAWFQAVNKIQEIGRRHGVGYNFQQAWDLARNQYPGLYANAFKDPEVNVITGASTDEASHLVGEIANRVRLASRCDFRNGWGFVQNELPELFNRLTPFAARIRNRDLDREAALFKVKAQRLFSKLVFAEQVSHSISHSHAWQIVKDQQPALAGLADGQMTAEQAFSLNPELRSRLV